MSTEKKLTGYPSIDKPWLKYYSEEAINAEIPSLTMYEYVYEINKDYLDDVAMVYQNKKITYRHVFDQIDMLADKFAAKGVKEGDIVTVLSLNTPETIYMFYALNKIGAVACMEYVTQTKESLKKSLDAIKPKMVIILNLFMHIYEEVIEEYEGETIVISPVEMLSAPVRMMVHAKMKIKKSLPDNAKSYKAFVNGKGTKATVVSKADIHSVLLSTSGSTGIPKKVALTNRNINSIAVQYKLSGMNINRKDKFIAMAPPFHAFGVSLGIHLPLCCGVLCIISTDPSPDKSAELFAKYNPNLFLGAVDHIIKITENPDVHKLDLSDLHTIAVGGETMSDTLRDGVNAFLKSHNAKGKLVTGYGMSELAGTAVTEKTDVWRDGSVGIPQSLVTVKIVNIDTNEECKYGVEGEILISSPAMMQEYFNNQEETDKAIEVDLNGIKWIHTGDLGYIDEDGFVFVKGRLKRIYTTLDMSTGQTYKLFPDYIESELDKISFVSRSAVLAIEDETRMHVAVAFLRMKETVDDWEQEIVRILEEELPAYDIPVKFIVVEDLPLLASGKLDYKRLEQIIK